MAPKLTLHFTPGSPPARACLFLMKYLNLECELKVVNLLAGEQNSEEFVKLNPARKIPVFVEDDFVLTESRAILAYLVSSRKAGSDLSPTDPKARALVDQRLYYDATVVFLKLVELVRPVIYFGETKVPQETKDGVREVLKVLDGFLEGKQYFAGDNLTIADFSISANVVSFAEFGFDLSEYNNLSKWFDKIKCLPGFNENLAGAKGLADRLKNLVDGSVY